MTGHLVSPVLPDHPREPCSLSVIKRRGGVMGQHSSPARNAHIGRYRHTTANRHLVKELSGSPNLNLDNFARYGSVTWRSSSPLSLNSNERVPPVDSGSGKQKWEREQKWGQKRAEMGSGLFSGPAPRSQCAFQAPPHPAGSHWRSL